jgi:hypothetical protein
MKIIPFLCDGIFLANKGAGFEVLGNEAVATIEKRKIVWFLSATKIHQ